ncbi:5-formyltetrahydrofolate cyclo-ligase [Aquirufa sp. Wall-65K1]
MKKSDIRNRHASQRKSWSQEEWLLQNLRIKEILFDFLKQVPPGCLMLSFQSIESKREVDTKTINEKLLLPPFEFQLAFPRVEGDGIMSAYLSDEKTIWHKSSWNILEPDPTTSKKIKPSTLQAILVPLIGFDLQGHRVGFGKGFYDRFLALCDPACLKIGLSLEEPVAQIEDLHAHDIPLDVVVTPERLYSIHGISPKNPFLFKI